MRFVWDIFPGAQGHRWLEPSASLYFMPLLSAPTHRDSSAHLFSFSSGMLNTPLDEASPPFPVSGAELLYIRLPSTAYLVALGSSLWASHPSSPSRRHPPGPGLVHTYASSLWPLTTLRKPGCLVLSKGSAISRVLIPGIEPQRLGTAKHG